MFDSRVQRTFRGALQWHARLFPIPYIAHAPCLAEDSAFRDTRCTSRLAPSFPGRLDGASNPRRWKFSFVANLPKCASLHDDEALSAERRGDAKRDGEEVPTRELRPSVLRHSLWPADPARAS
eukprot:scaffold1245_cov252-Pinguiococcus_pyrenoidosus.AAC.13